MATIRKKWRGLRIHHFFLHGLAMPRRPSYPLTRHQKLTRGRRPQRGAVEVVVDPLPSAAPVQVDDPPTAPVDVEAEDTEDADGE